MMKEGSWIYLFRFSERGIYAPSGLKLIGCGTRTTGSGKDSPVSVLYLGLALQETSLEERRSWYRVKTHRFRRCILD